MESDSEQSLKHDFLLEKFETFGISRMERKLVILKHVSCELIWATFQLNIKN
jgi:hypothetical protein